MELVNQSRLLTPQFLNTLREKCFSYVLALERHHGDRGKRLDTKQLVNDPLYRALHYYREFCSSHEVLQGLQGEFPSSVPSTLLKADPIQTDVLIAECLRAVGAGNPKPLRQLADLVELNECTRVRQDIFLRNSEVLPWHYYVGMAALKFLNDGIIPTRADVKGLAIKFRAGVHFSPSADEKMIKEKIDEMRKQAPRQWRRIFRELDLADLPPR